MQYGALILLSALTATRADHKFTPDSDFTLDENDQIYKLHDDDFDKFIKRYPTTLVEFYAPWCGHCKNLAPEYSAAARTLREHKVNVQLAKVDATAESEIAKKYDINGYPTLKWWKDGEGPSDYDGPRDHPGIVTWIREKTDPKYKPPPSAVKVLTKDNFDTYTADKDLVLVEFYAPWCGHCKKLEPEYERAAIRLLANDPPIYLAKVDATKESELAKEYGVGGYPTLKILRKGKRFDYNGPREADGIVKYMKEQARPAAQALDSARTASRIITSADDVVVIAFVRGDSTEQDTFVQAAEQLREDYSNCYFTTDDKITSALKAKMGTLRVYQPKKYTSKYEDAYKEMDLADKTKEDVVAFIEKSSVPLVGHRSQKHAKRFDQNPLVVVYYMVNFSFDYIEGTQYWRNKVLEVAKDWSPRYHFAISDEEEFQHELNAAGLADSGMEVNVIAYGFDGKKYPWNPDKFGEDEFTVETFQKFMEELSSNRIKPYVKSAPAPKNDKGPVRTVVASTFDAIVKDETKDVLIEFYAPWCGHCKNLEPKYKDMAQKLSSDKNLVIAKYDATANDAPTNYNVEGFPTIYFAPKGKKDHPIKYRGNRDIDDIIKFMKENKVVSFADKTEL